MSEPVYEMVWDCAYCGAAKLLGKTHRHCPNCGGAQDPTTRYFPPEDEKVAVEDHEFVGADVRCEACDTPNSAAASFCCNCGSALDDAKKVDLVSDDPSEEAPEEKPKPPPQAGQGGGGIGKYLFGCGCLSIAAFALVICLLGTFWNESDTAVVSGHTWERTVQVERFGPKSESDWCNDMPSDAYSVKRKDKEKSTKKVPDGETCKTKNVDNGDGTFRQKEECKPKFKEEPVYAKWCSYKVDDWADQRIEKANGADLSPKWPKLKLKGCPTPTQGCERQGERNETYTVILKDSSGEKHKCGFPEPKWKSIKDGSKYEVDIRVLTGGIDCSSLR